MADLLAGGGVRSMTPEQIADAELYYNRDYWDHHYHDLQASSHALYMA